MRIHHVAIWREAALFSDSERAALEWGEALTKLPPHGVVDELYAAVRSHLSEDELVYLTYMVINA